MFKSKLIFFCLFIFLNIATKKHNITTEEIIEELKKDIVISDNIAFEKSVKKALALIDYRETKFAVDAEHYYEFVGNLLSLHAVKTGAEIGVLYGGLSEKICEKNLGIETFYLIDPFCEKFYGDEILAECMFAKLRKRMKLYKNAYLLRDFSASAASKIKDESLDFVFIDASHEYEDVKQDILIWAPKVKKGGLVMGDDYHINTPGVIKAVNEFTSYCNVSCGRIWWIVK